MTYDDLRQHEAWQAASLEMSGLPTFTILKIKLLRYYTFGLEASPGQIHCPWPWYRHLGVESCTGNVLALPSNRRKSYNYNNLIIINILIINEYLSKSNVHYLSCQTYCVVRTFVSALAVCLKTLALRVDILALTLYGHIKTAQQPTIIQQYGNWYTDRWWVGCYIWYSEKEMGVARK